jgi:hypothetical protein
MDARLQEMLDHHEIRKLLAEYCHGCDRVDAKGMAGVYHANSHVDHGPFHCPGPEFTQQVMKSLQANSEMGFHQLGQSLINVRGDEAGAETYFFAVVRRTKENGLKVLDFVGGRYADVLQRENGAWKVKHRTCIREWTFDTEIPFDDPASKVFTMGQRSGADLSYAVLGMKHAGPQLA